MTTGWRPLSGTVASPWLREYADDVDQGPCRYFVAALCTAVVIANIET
ncbi:hypothetical protein [Streptomyces sp. NBC_00019]